ncbi:hypothetical protein EVAR_57385_1 [Eumeta japonica]|uniref:Uncharacterized protein n=1 Tax=Eumeta variegata TaxID=151549 RepID=A0A4C1ZGM5_EUMVA|nr:hypothetical protein EVAR_57385_1 [Eumeta japonica]
MAGAARYRREAHARSKYWIAPIAFGDDGGCLRRPDLPLNALPTSARRVGSCICGVVRLADRDVSVVALCISVESTHPVFVPSGTGTGSGIEIKSATKITITIKCSSFEIGTAMESDTGVETESGDQKCGRIGFRSRPGSGSAPTMRSIKVKT